MQNAPVDVATVSQRDPLLCTECGHLLDGFLAFHLCPKCHSPQLLREGETYFDAFGVPVQFDLDRGVIEKRFYEISRALHPDRFVSAPAHHRAQSMSRMSFLNQAFQTLKNPTALRELMLSLYGVRTQMGILPSHQQKKVPIPVEIAESWFELQELVVENPASSRPKVAEFEAELKNLRTQGEAHLKALETQFDRLPRELSPELLAILSQIDAELQKQNYFRSIEKDVERIKRNAHSD